MDSKSPSESTGRFAAEQGAKRRARLEIVWRLACACCALAFVFSVASTVVAIRATGAATVNSTLVVVREAVFSRFVGDAALFRAPPAELIEKGFLIDQEVAGPGSKGLIRTVPSIRQTNDDVDAHIRSMLNEIPWRNSNCDSEGFDPSYGVMAQDSSGRALSVVELRAAMLSKAQVSLVFVGNPGARLGLSSPVEFEFSTLQLTSTRSRWFSETTCSKLIAFVPKCGCYPRQ